MNQEDLLAFYKTVATAIADHLKITDPDLFTEVLKEIIQVVTKDRTQ